MIYIGMEKMAFFIILVILITVLLGWKDETKSTKMFAINMIIILVGMAFDICSWFTWTNANRNVLFSSISILIGNAIAPGFAYYMVFQTKEKKGKVVLPIVMARIVLLINSIAAVIGIVSIFTGDLYHVENGAAVPGIGVGIIYLMDLIASLFMLVVLAIYSKEIEKKLKFMLFLIIVTPLLAAVIELFFQEVYLSYLSLSISVLLLYAIIQANVISEAKVRAEIISEISLTDDMTGLLNRRAYSKFLSSVGDSVQGGVIFFDINGLKRTNDKKGHMEGDRLITDFAKILTESMPSGKIYRISGDEFVAVYLGEEAKKNYDDEKYSIQERIKMHDDIAAMGAFWSDKMHIISLINEAEKNMYLDKERYHKKIE